MRAIALCLLTATLMTGCGGAKPPAAPQHRTADATSQPAAASPEPKPSSDSDAAGQAHLDVPTACAGSSSNPCLMPLAFVKRLCAGAFPDLALYLFQKSSPWTRAYVAVREAEPFNGLGGPNSDQKLLFEEELIILAERKPDMGGMTVSGVGSSYDLLRWDGTCVTLSAQEVRTQRPPRPGNAEVVWRYLEEGTQNALLEDERIAKAVAERRKECKGVTMGEVSAKCEKADKELKTRVVEAIRDGKSVPRPSKLP
jgi:hypothetical protein